MDFTTEPTQRSLMLKRLFILAGGMFIGLMIAGMLAMLLGNDTTPRVRVVTIFQDMFVFILPAVGAAMLSSRLPALWLSVDRSFPLWALVAAVLLMVVSIPLQNSLIHWNEAISLPASLASVERWMADAQLRADSSLELLMGGSSVADLIMDLLIVGVFAALSEELFFRGALQRILQGNNSGAHAAIWTAAIIFSAFHFQFYGFVPRILLGALFGYLVWWSGSLWLPVIVHTLNNSIVVITRWMSMRSGSDNVIDTIGTGNTWMVVASVILTGLALWLVRRACRHQ